MSKFLKFTEDTPNGPRPVWMNPAIAEIFAVRANFITSGTQIHSVNDGVCFFKETPEEVIEALDEYDARQSLRS